MEPSPDTTPTSPAAGKAPEGTAPQAHEGSEGTVPAPHEGPEDSIPDDGEHPRKKFFKNKMPWYIAAAAAFLLLTAFSVHLTVNLVKHNWGDSAQRETAAAPQPETKKSETPKSQPQKKPEETAAQEEADRENAKIDAEINSVIDEINKRAAQNNRTPGEPGEITGGREANEQTGMLTGEEVEEKEIQTAGNPPTPTPDPQNNKITDQRRYLMVALYDLTGGADIAVTDSYTGETRLFENVAGKKKIFSFSEKQAASAGGGGSGLRYTPLVFHNSGRIDGAVVDEYTGELRKLTGLTPVRPVNPFNNNDSKGAGELRYRVGVEFVASDIVLYFTDTFTGEIRARTVQELPAALNLFTGPRDQGAGSRRYFSWATYGGDILTECFCIDTYTSEIKMLPNIREKKAVTFFESTRGTGALRYEGWSIYRHGHILFFVIDTFTSEIKMRSMTEFTGPLKLFDNKDHRFTDWFRRYTAGVGFLPNGAMITYAADAFSGEIKIKTGDPGNLPGPVRYFNAPKEPGVPRFQVYVFFQYESGADVYQMDTFSGEIRIKTNVAGNRVLKLFR